MKILCLSDSLGYRGGAERQLSGLVYLLYRKGYDVQAATYLKQQNPSVLELNYGLNYKCLDASGMLSKIVKVGRLIRQNDFDTVIAYKDGPTQVCCILKMLGFKFNLIVSERNTTTRLNIREWLKFKSYRFANHIVPNSYSQGEYIKKHFPSLSGKISVVTNYVDTERFRPVDFVFPEIVSCIVVSSIKEQKNPLLFIEALNILKSKGVRIQVDWYGSINNRQLFDECHERIKKYNLQDYIKILPTSPAIHEEYPKYELFCLPSFFEGFPNTLCEAMSCGLPVIASDVCDNPFILDNGQYGMLCNPKDANSIALAIEDYIMKRRDNRKEESLRNRERIISMCSEESFVNKYIKLIEQ